jgi:hypothetical protein
MEIQVMFAPIAMPHAQDVHPQAQIALAAIVLILGKPAQLCV